MAVKKITPEAVAQAIRDVIVEQGVPSVEIENIAARLGVSRQTVWRHCGNGSDWQAACRQAVAQYEQRGDLALSKALERARTIYRAIGAADVTYGPRSHCRYEPIYEYARKQPTSYLDISTATGFDLSAVRRAFGGGASKLPHVLRKLYPDDPPH